MKRFDVARLATAAASINGGQAVAATEAIVVSTGMNVIAALKRQTQAQGLAINIEIEDPGSGIRESIRLAVLASLLGAERYLSGADMPPRFLAKIERIKQQAVKPLFDSAAARIRMEDLHSDLIAELSEPMFLCISQGKRELYEQNSPPFGPEVGSRFEGATRDIAAAARCLAVDEPTACVFHCMRVLEHGLRPIASRFDVSFKVESWHAVIKGIEEGIKTLRNKGTLTEVERTEIQFYSEAAAEFRHFKDAWRNHVTHSKEHYGERDAEKVYGHVRDFMQKMAEQEMAEGA